MAQSGHGTTVGALAHPGEAARNPRRYPPPQPSHTRLVMRVVGLLAALSVLAVGVASAQAMSAPPALKWGPAPPAFPAGGKMAGVPGHPPKPGMVTGPRGCTGGVTAAPHRA